MTKRDKLIGRLRARPSDFSFDELVSLMGQFGYKPLSSGKTGGSRVAFANAEGDYLRLHKPHPRKILKRYQIDDVIDALEERGLL